VTFITFGYFNSQNTYTNTDKLLSAAEELARTGECDAEEIYTVATHLESVVNNFAARVQQRRRLVDSAVIFYSQEKQVKNEECDFHFMRLQIVVVGPFLLHMLSRAFV